jgi:hypothetical protein
LSRALFLGAFLCTACSRDSTEVPQTVLLRLAQEEERVARLELEAAKSKKFYYLVDVGASSLSLRLTGVVLGVYPLESVDLGVPIRAMRPAGELDEELAPLFSCKSTVIEEPREIIPGAPPDPVDPEAEAEAGSMSRAVLVCDPPLTVHIARSYALGFRERVRLPGDDPVDRRVRVIVPRDEAERLFASLPQEMLLLFSRLPRAH